MTDSKREARELDMDDIVGKSFVPEESYDSLLKENQELKAKVSEWQGRAKHWRDAHRDLHDRHGRYILDAMTEITRLREALEEIKAEVGTSTKAWNLADQALARADGNEGV